MKTPFAQPVFEGVRFDEHTLPVEVAGDLIAYEELILNLARHLYLKEHPHRKRVPKGFGKDFQLHLEKVDEGSARPLLSLLLAAGLELSEEVTYFHRAKDLVEQCVSAPADQLPEDFPKELLTTFNRLGRSLREGESVNLAGLNQPESRLTPERRKTLVLAADQVYEREFTLAGVMEEADWEKSTFRLRVGEKERITVPMEKAFHAKARVYGGRDRHHVQVTGVASYDSWDRLQKVLTVSALDIQEDVEILARFEELRSLEDGWFDGQGLAPDLLALDFVADALIGSYPEKLPLPAIIPTPEGNLLFEWRVSGDPSLDLFLEGFQAHFHAFLPDGGDMEQDFTLDTSDAWSSFFEFLTHHLGPVSS